MEKKKKRSFTRGIILAVLAVAIGYTVYAAVTKDTVKIVKAGADAPDFEVVDLNGEKHRLADYEGQGVLLNFWGTWCAPCEREFPAMTKQYGKSKHEGVQIIAVNFAQSEFEVKKYVQNMGMTFPVAIDKTKSVFTAYNIGPLPTSIFIKPDGEIERIVTGEMSEQQISNYLDSIKPE
ncbi:thiol-disulfide oxidoreductase [Lysinibacillus sp. 2017]|uniref:thiol-disulfide oxidoreductase ResA n=1 Tax=unclassified Lysinibacillus TaxID=2636778 RepID=UPI000D527BAC|nr:MULTISPECIES: thiol-disulfide oxidoreductase ResA [unclassified Lysinibacillus]AWE06886.1 thiol-disulfide oxidoreductase [Lysinibacillus sp. 2017]TGN37183.1 thiol-disulfide oxidoreductase ResA [Lysinibacillus sp. S2017]